MLLTRHLPDQRASSTKLVLIRFALTINMLISTIVILIDMACRSRAHTGGHLASRVLAVRHMSSPLGAQRSVPRDFLSCAFYSAHQDAAQDQFKFQRGQGAQGAESFDSSYPYSYSGMSLPFDGSMSSHLPTQQGAHQQQTLALNMRLIVVVCRILECGSLR